MAANAAHRMPVQNSTSPSSGRCTIMRTVDNSRRIAVATENVLLVVGFIREHSVYGEGFIPITKANLSEKQN